MDHGLARSALAFLPTLPQIFLCGIAIPFLLITAYRLTLHPLAKYPGPLAYKISGWPLVYQCYKGNRHLNNLRDHEKYGPFLSLAPTPLSHPCLLGLQLPTVTCPLRRYHPQAATNHFLSSPAAGSIVRTSPNSLSFSSPTALHQIYGSRAVNVRKSQFYEILDGGAGGSTTHTEIDKERHAARRRILNLAFSESALRETEFFVIDNVRKFINLIGPDSGLRVEAGLAPEGTKNSKGPDSHKDGGWSPPRNMSRYLDWLAYDIMGNLVFGKGYNCLGSDEYRQMPRIVTEGTKFGYWFAHLPYAPLLLPLTTTAFMQWIGGETARDNVRNVEYAISQFKERAALEEERKKLKVNPTRKDLMHYLLNNADPKTGIRPTTGELQGDTLSLIGAGADTIATTLSASFFYLTRNQDVLQRLQAEIRSAFATLEEIHSGPKMDSCTYLNACIEETLRLAPAVASQLPREVMKGGIVIDGEYIPEGVVLGVPSYVVHHDRDAFPDPWSFRPERWIAGSKLDEEGVTVSKEDIRTAREAMCPFSLGSRGCIGKVFAYMEMRNAIASVLWYYDFNEVEGSERKGGGGSDLEQGRERVDEYQIFDCFGADRDGPVLRFRRRS